MRISKERLKELIKEELQNVIEAEEVAGSSQVAQQVIAALRVGDGAEDQVLTQFITMWGEAAGAGSIGRHPKVIRLLGLIEEALKKFLAEPEAEGGAEKPDVPQAAATTAPAAPAAKPAIQENRKRRRRR